MQQGRSVSSRAVSRTKHTDIDLRRCRKCATADTYSTDESGTWPALPHVQVGASSASCETSRREDGLLPLWELIGLKHRGSVGDECLSC